MLYSKALCEYYKLDINYIFPERLIKMLFKYIPCIHINIMYKNIYIIKMNKIF